MINSKVLKVYWFGNAHSKDKYMGIVKTQDEITKEFKFYIGFGHGLNEKSDIEHIIAWGIKYTHDEFKEIYSKFIEIH